MNIDNFSPDPEIRCKNYKIGCIGSGFIMADVQLMAYNEAGFDVVAIASRTESNAKKVAESLLTFRLKIISFFLFIC